MTSGCGIRRTFLAELKKLNRSTCFLDERHEDTGRRLVWFDDHFLAPDCFVKVVDLKGDVGQSLHDVWECAVVVKSHPLNPVRRGHVIGHRHLQPVKIHRPSERFGRGNPDVVVSK